MLSIVVPQYKSGKNREGDPAAASIRAIGRVGTMAMARGTKRTGRAFKNPRGTIKRTALHNNGAITGKLGLHSGKGEHKSIIN